MANLFLQLAFMYKTHFLLKNESWHWPFHGPRNERAFMVAGAKSRFGYVHVVRTLWNRPCTYPICLMTLPLGAYVLNGRHLLGRNQDAFLSHFCRIQISLSGSSSSFFDIALQLHCSWLSVFDVRLYSS